MSKPTAFIPGLPPVKRGPLARFLPPYRHGVVSSWLDRNIPKGSWLVDPFGSSPALVIEAARSGYRILVACHNPVARFLLDMNANPPETEQLSAALAELAATKKGDERLEPHIKSLYMTECFNCKNNVMAQAFLWERDAIGTTNAPYAALYHCQTCGERGEHPLTEKDALRASRFSRGGLHRARALERVAPLDDPDRTYVEEAISSYLPRAVYALFTIINKIDGLYLPQNKRRNLEALLLSACDRANTLWSYPSGRPRPRQLTVPTRFRENNVWLALEEAIEEWSFSNPSIPITEYPNLPPNDGGICVFEGHIKNITIVENKFDPTEIGALLTSFPRPNQAFWTLSALWSGWLWGQESLGPYKGVLRRRRYDWAWHCNALLQTLEGLAHQLQPETPFFGLIGESEPSYLSAVSLAARWAHFKLQNFRLRAETEQAQIYWEFKPQRDLAYIPENPLSDNTREAIQDYLEKRGEPSDFHYLHAAALSSLTSSHTWLKDEEKKAYSSKDVSAGLNLINTAIKDAVSLSGKFQRFGRGEKTVSSGSWWLKSAEGDRSPLSDRVELCVLRYLTQNKTVSKSETDDIVCKSFPGPITPSPNLVHACLESYAEQDSQNLDLWHIRQEDLPAARRERFHGISSQLKQIAQRLMYNNFNDKPLIWKAPESEGEYYFHIITTAIIGNIVYTHRSDAQRSIIVLPGNRTSLIDFKIRNNPYLKDEINQGWRFLKFKRVLWLANNPELKREYLQDQLNLDELKYDGPQMRLL